MSVVVNEARKEVDMQTRALSNQAVFRGSIQFQTELASGIVLSGNVNLKAELPMNEQELRTFLHQPEDTIEQVLVGLYGLNGHSKRVVNS